MITSFVHAQDSLKNSSSSAPDEDTLTSPSSESMATPHRQPLPDRPASPDKEPQAGRGTLQQLEPQSRELKKKGNLNVGQGQHAMQRHEKPIQEPHNTDAGFLFQHKGGQSAALLDTSATLSDWILRSASSSAGASQRGSEAAEADAGAGPPAAESAGVPSQLLDSLASLSDWAHGGDGLRNRPPAPGGYRPGLSPLPNSAQACCDMEIPSVRMVHEPEEHENGLQTERSSTACAGPSRMGAGPASFPVALSDGSMSRLSSVSPVKHRRARHPGLPASAPIRPAQSLEIPRSACCASDVEDTADSGSPQSQLRSSASSRAGEGSGSSLGRGALEKHYMQEAAKPGGSASTAAAVARPQRRASEPAAGASGGRAPLSRAVPEREAESTSGHSAAKPAGSSSVSMQPGQVLPATDVDSPRMVGGSAPVPAQRRQSEGNGVSEAQVPALEKLKRRMQRRQRSSLQDASMAPALQAQSSTGKAITCPDCQMQHPDTHASVKFIHLDMHHTRSVVTAA